MKNPDFHCRFLPLTANPYSRDRTYLEVAPVPALRSYVRCFWGSEEKFLLSKAQLYTNHLVIPDTCVDMIIQMDEEHIICRFCGLDQESYFSSMDRGSYAIFAVRLYFWAVPFLIQEEARCMAAPVSGCEEYFPGIERYLKERQFSSCSFEERKQHLENYLLKRMDTLERRIVPAPILNSVEFLLRHPGDAAVKKMADHCSVSSRTLERLFHRHLGIPPKKLADLVRYQILWQHAVSRRDFRIQDEVFELGFYDQAHLLNTFRKYHGMNLGEALAYSSAGVAGDGACRNCGADAFFQYDLSLFC